jgi:hypothetical protein
MSASTMGLWLQPRDHKIGEPHEEVEELEEEVREPRLRRRRLGLPAVVGVTHGRGTTRPWCPSPLSCSGEKMVGSTLSEKELLQMVGCDDRCYCTTTARAARLQATCCGCGGTVAGSAGHRRA